MTSRDGRNPAATVRTRAAVGPVNTFFLIGFACGGLAWLFQPGGSSYPQAYILFGFACLVCAIGLGGGIRMLQRDYRLRKDLAISRRVTTDHGSARQATVTERAERGMHDWRSGDLLGLDDRGRPVFRPADAPFGLYEMPPGVGKTVCYVVGSILHRARRGYSVVVADPKMDLAPMLAPGLRTLGFEVWCANPTHAFLDLCGEVELNPYQALLDAGYAEGPDRLDTAKHAGDYASIHYPPRRDDKNPYFVHGSRRALVAGLMDRAMTDPANCTPTGLYVALTDPGLFLSRMGRAAGSLESVMPDDPLVAFLRGEARNLVHRAKKNEENFGAFLEGASQRLISFNPSGRLAHYGRTAIRNIAELRERQVILFIMTPLSHQREFADFISLLNHNIIAACKSNPGGHSVHIVAEEALNYRFTNLVSDLETMRQLKVTADFYVQSFAGLEKQYGREAAQAIESYADVRVYAGLNSLARAKHLSDMLSEATIRKQDYSMQAVVRELGVSSRELGRPLMKPNEVLAMTGGQAWAFVRGMNPMKLRMVSYGQVSPWRDWTAPSPISGERLYDTPLVTIGYDKEDKTHDRR